MTLIFTHTFLFFTSHSLSSEFTLCLSLSLVLRMSHTCMTMLLLTMFILTVVAESPATSPKVSSLTTPAAAPSPSSVSPLPPSSVSSPPAHAPAPRKSGAASHGFSFAGIFVVALAATALIL